MPLLRRLEQVDNAYCRPEDDARCYYHADNERRKIVLMCPPVGGPDMRLSDHVFILANPPEVNTKRHFAGSLRAGAEQTGIYEAAVM